jgi:UDP-N-acetylglucosamine--N-acetylmuramyl-(pentapeptide) pyrophosphoryl-undecaprenol N-acetylglucosamine transferase
MSNLKFILSGGGTGGHIYPAIAIANELKRRYPDAEFLFVGAKDRMEMEKVPNAGFEIKGLWISGIQRKLTVTNLMFPFKLLSSLWKSRSIIKRFKPDVVIGTGGFASGPLLKMANSKNIPTLIQEQNSYAGITNKWLADKANRICVAYDHMEKYFPAEKIIKTGNPVRQDIKDLESKRAEAIDHFELDETRKTVLVLGGSLGAKRVNELIANHAKDFEETGVNVIWQTGKLYYEQYKTLEENKRLQVKEYINRMDLAYSVADIIISRAGAGSVSELCIVGKPVILIPSPNVAENHQMKNAMALAVEEACLIMKESEMDEQFKRQFINLLEDDVMQAKLSENIKKLARPNATIDIANEVELLIKRNA